MPDGGDRPTDGGDESGSADEDSAIGLLVLVAVVLAVLVVVGWVVGAVVAATVAFGGGPGLAETPHVVEDTATPPAPREVVVGNDSVAAARGTLAFADDFEDGDLVGWEVDREDGATVDADDGQVRLATVDCGGVTVSRPVGQRDGTVVVSLDWATVARGAAAPVSARLVTRDGRTVASRVVGGWGPTARDDDSLRNAVRLAADTDEALVLQLRVGARDDCETTDGRTYLFVDDVRVTVQE